MRRLFLDIETSPNVVLAFKAGYDLVINHDAIIKERKIICAAFCWEGENKTTILRWDSDQDDKQLLIRLCKVLEQADEVVGHYIDKFDWPWIITRCLIHKLPPPPIVKTIDTKAWSSRLYFNSNRLDYVSQVLGHGAKEKMEFDDWKQIVLHNDKKAMDKMCHYCGVDVEKLEKVYHDLAPYMKPKSHVGVLIGGDKWTCPRTGTTKVVLNKRRVTASGARQYTMQSQTDGSYFTISETAYKAYQAAKKPTK